MTTASDLISAALRKVSSDTPSDVINGQEIATALDELNRMLASWSTESFMPQFRTLENFPLVANTLSYTIGSGATFSTVRPDVTQNGCFIRDTNSIDTPLTLITREQYDGTPLKTSPGRPIYLFYDKQYPSGIVYLYPSPDQAYTIYLDTLKPFVQFAATTTSYAFPPEYQDAIIWNLSLRLAPEVGFSLQDHPEIVEFARESKKLIKALNAKPPVVDFDPYLISKNGFVQRGWNIYNV